MNRNLLMLGSINALLAVALGAFGAHGLEDRLSADRMDVYETAAHYHLIHGAALVLIAVIAGKAQGSALVSRAGWLIAAGILFFSGSLYVLSVSGVEWLGAVAPVGGLCFLAGWLLLAIYGYRSKG